MIMPHESYGGALQLPSQYLSYIRRQLGCEHRVCEPGIRTCYCCQFLLSYFSSATGFHRISSVYLAQGTGLTQNLWAAHFRYFMVTEKEFDAAGIGRENVSLDGSGKDNTKYLREVKISLALTMEVGMPMIKMPCWTIIFLADDSLDPCPTNWMDDIEARGYSGIISFVRCILYSLEEMCSAWDGVLENLDDQKGVTVSLPVIGFLVLRH